MSSLEEQDRHHHDAAYVSQPKAVQCLRDRWFGKLKESGLDGNFPKQFLQLEGKVEKLSDACCHTRSVADNEHSTTLGLEAIPHQLAIQPSIRFRSFT
jgi:hypothetical protein